MRKEQQIQRIKELLDLKKSRSEIVDELGISRQRVAKIIKDYLPQYQTVKQTADKPHRLGGRPLTTKGTPRKYGSGKLQVMTYPAKNTKAVLARAAKAAGMPLSKYLLLAGLEKAAGSTKVPSDLIPEGEYRDLVG